MKRTSMTLLATLLGFVGTSFAQSGYFSEIKISFTQQKALLPPSPILTPGPNDGSYLICAYLEQYAADSLGAVLSWTDENGNPQQSVLVAAESGETSGCTPIRNQANTAPTIATTGILSSTYSIYVDGFGFWNVGPDKQAGITEPVTADYHKATENLRATSLLFTNTYDTYLFAATLVPYSQSDKLSASIGWYDATGSHSVTLVANQNQGVQKVFLVRTIPHTYIMLSTEGTVSDEYDLNVHGLKFGTPSQGPGPMAFHGRSFLHWVNPITYTDEVPPGMWLMSANAENVSDTGPLLVHGFPVVFTIDGTADGSGVGAAYKNTADLETFYTRCGGLGLTCPLYSAEFDLVVF